MKPQNWWEFGKSVLFALSLVAQAHEKVVGHPTIFSEIGSAVQAWLLGNALYHNNTGSKEIRYGGQELPPAVGGKTEILGEDDTKK